VLILIYNHTGGICITASKLLFSANSIAIGPSGFDDEFTKQVQGIIRC